MSVAGRRVSGRRSGRAAAAIGALLLAAGFAGAQPPGAAPPSATAPADRLVTPDGWFARPEVDKPALPAGGVKRAYVIPITGAITVATEQAVYRKIIPIRTGKAKAELIVFEMDTPGGSGQAMAAIVRTVMQELKDVYTVAYVNPDALSAGAIISVACDEIVMSPTGRIGAAMPIMISPTGQIVEIPEKERGKFESAQLAGARVMARRNGYDEDLIEGMITIDRMIWLIRQRRTRQLQIVDAADWYGRVADVPPGRRPTTAPAEPRQAEWEYVRTIAEPNKLVTLTAHEAVAYGLASRVVDSDDALRQAFNIAVAPTVLVDTWSERLVALLNSAPAMALLLFVGVLALYVELNSPGFGLPGAMAVLCFAILFGSRFLTGLANWWEIGLFILGVGLLLAEVFVTPGFGVLGIAGILCCIAALLMMVVPNAPDEWPWPDTDLAWEMFSRGATGLAVALLSAVAAAVVLARYLPKVPLAGRLVLAAPVAGRAAPTSEQAGILAVRPGQTGEVVQVCRPVGKVQIGDQLVDAVANGAFLAKGSRVVVLRNEGNRVVVEAKGER